MEFPKRFFWGTATSSHQIEGNNKNNDWWRAEQEGKLKYKSGVACDSYNRYEEDFDLAKELGTNAHRLSIEWSRVEPEEGKFDEAEMEHYKKVIRALKARGIEPFVTLHHFTNPVWFADKGGWLNKKAPFYFARYAEYVVKNLPDVKFWITINEPLILSLNGYMRANWPPFKSGWFHYLNAKNNLLEAHIDAYQKIKSINLNSKVGIAKNNTYFEPYRNRLIARIFAAYVNRNWNLKPLSRIRKYQDFVGLNYYFHNRIKPGFCAIEKWFNHNENKKVSDFGWEIYPKGIYHITKQAWNKYKRPIYIFENGIADASDEKRSDFIRDHLKWLNKAIKEGADVRGYFHWSLLDNFEWTEGYKMKFGLVEVDFETLKRIPRDSYYVYKKICETNSLNSK